jgi:hypothetical protein
MALLMTRRLVAAVYTMSVLLIGLMPLPAIAADEALTIAPEPAAAPWWRRVQWSPKATVVRGVPIKRLHPDWCAAEAFSRERFGEALLAEGDALGGLDFMVEGNFDGSGRPQIAFVGVYRRCAGEQGLFAAIVEPHGERPRMRFLVEVPDNAGARGSFAALGREPDGTLAAYWCAACELGVRIEFSRESKGFFVAGPASLRHR